MVISGLLRMAEGLLTVSNPYTTTNAGRKMIAAEGICVDVDPCFGAVSPLNGAQRCDV